MPKPIVLVYLNYKLLDKPRTDGIDWIKSMQEMLSNTWNDYHVLCIPDENQRRVMQIQTWYDKDFREENFKAFETHVVDILSKQKLWPTNPEKK